MIACATRGLRLTRIGVGDDDDLRSLVFHALQPGSEVVQTLAALRRQHGPARLEQLRFGEILTIPLAVAANQQLGRILDVIAHDRHVLDGIRALSDRNYRIAALME